MRDYNNSVKHNKLNVECDDEMNAFIAKFDKILMEKYNEYRQELRKDCNEKSKKMYELVDKLNEIAGAMGKLGFGVSIYDEQLAYEYDFTHSNGFVEEYKVNGVKIDCFKDPDRNYFADYMRENKIFNRSSEIESLKDELEKAQRNIFRFTKQNQKNIEELKSKIDVLKRSQSKYERLNELSNRYNSLDKSGKETFSNFMKLKRELYDQENEVCLSSGRIRRMDRVNNFLKDDFNNEVVNEIFNKTWASIPQEEKDMFIKKLNNFAGKQAYDEKRVLTILEEREK